MLVFMYGSLKRGRSNHGSMERIGAVYAEDAVTARPEYDLVDLGAFPGLGKGAYYVHGELYSLDDKGVSSLDRFEGDPNFYYREGILVKTEFREIVVNTYFLNNSGFLHSTPIHEYYDEKCLIKVWRGR